MRLEPNLAITIRRLNAEESKNQLTSQFDCGKGQLLKYRLGEISRMGLVFVASRSLFKLSWVAAVGGT